MSRERQPARGGASLRLRVLDEGVAVVGRLWVAAARALLVSEGRGVVGAWPGTMSEARARARNHFLVELRRHRLAMLSASELESTARAAYAQARHEWLTHAERDPDDPALLGPRPREQSRGGLPTPSRSGGTS